MSIYQGRDEHVICKTYSLLYSDNWGNYFKVFIRCLKQKITKKMLRSGSQNV